MTHNTVGRYNTRGDCSIPVEGRQMSLDLCHNKKRRRRMVEKFQISVDKDGLARHTFEHIAMMEGG